MKRTQVLGVIALQWTTVCDFLLQSAYKLITITTTTCLLPSPKWAFSDMQNSLEEVGIARM